MKKLVKQLFFGLFIAPLALSAQTKATVSIHNESAMRREGAVVEIKWKNILVKYPGIDTANFIVVDPVTKKQVPYQLEKRGEKEIQNLLVQVDLKSKSTLNLLVQKGKPAVFAARTYARYVPERKDDFAWENDKIAFRAYGKALESSKNENAYGLDVWVKRTDKLILNERYKRGEYHIDHGDGMDYYHVGYTLGAGGMAPFVKDSVRYSANYHHWKVLDNGPLRSTFELGYDSWDAAGIQVKTVKTITLDAGSQLNRIEQVFTYDNAKPLPVVVGIIRRAENGNMMLNERQGILGYWEPQHGEDGITGVGSILMTPVKNMRVAKDQLLAETTAKNNEAIVYYAGAAWNKAGKITNEKQWFNYLENFYEQLKQPVTVSVK